MPLKAKQCELNCIDPDRNPAPELPDGVTCDNLNDIVGNHVDAMVALNINTGEIDWSFRAREYDPWVHACAYPDFYLPFFPPALGANNPALTQANIAQNCTDTLGPDVGFGQPPMLIENVGKGAGQAGSCRCRRKERLVLHGCC